MNTEQTSKNIFTYEKDLKQCFPIHRLLNTSGKMKRKQKAQYKYSIYPYFKDLLLVDIKNTAFTFKFDESTMQQVKKQYDGYSAEPREYLMIPFTLVTVNLD